jgi:hypothetical protein
MQISTLNDFLTEYFSEMDEIEFKKNIKVYLGGRLLLVG